MRNANKMSMDQIIRNMMRQYPERGNSNRPISVFELEHVVVTKSPEWEYLTGKKSFENRELIAQAQELAQAAIEEPRWSYQAGKRWEDKAFNRYAQKIGETVARSIEYSCYAGWDWQEEQRFNPYGKEFARTIAQKPVWAYIAGAEWPDTRFEPYKEMFVKAVEQDPECRYFTMNGEREYRNKFNRFQSSNAEVLWGMFGIGGVYSQSQIKPWKASRQALFSL